MNDSTDNRGTAFDDAFAVRAKYEIWDELSFRDGPSSATGEPDPSSFGGYTFYQIIDRSDGAVVYQAYGPWAEEDICERREKYNRMLSERPGLSKGEALSAVLPNYAKCHRTGTQALSLWSEKDIEDAWQDLVGRGEIGIDCDDVGQEDWDMLARMCERRLYSSEAYYDAGWEALSGAIIEASKEHGWDTKYPAAAMGGR
jgi:hypothetical protein